MEPQSKCKPGEEKHQKFFSKILKKQMIQYEYRSLDGRLFSCVGPTIDACRMKIFRMLGEEK